MPGLFASGARRREPQPYDSLWTINGQPVGLMLGRDPKGGDLVTEMPPSQASVVRSDYGYAADNPRFGRVASYGRMPRGMGLKHQVADNPADDLQYDHGINADLSSGLWLKGPDITTFTPTTTDATNGVTAFIEVAGTLYPIVGRYALSRAGDASFPVSQDFGAGTAALDAINFQSNALGADYGFVAMGDAEHLWYVTGGTWTQHASLFARAFGFGGRDFYRAHSTNTLAKVDPDADPTVAGNWQNANAFTVGDKSSAIARIATTPTKALLAIKTDGVFTLAENGDDVNLFPQLRLSQDAQNGKALAYFGPDVFVGFTYSGFFKLTDQGGVIDGEPCGPELLLENGSEVTGYVTAACGAQFGLYGGWYNPDSGDSYLCVYKGMRTTPDGKRVPIWHGSLSLKFAGKKITAMHRSTIGAPSGHQRMYLGFSDGSLGWFTLSCKANPADCSSYGFSTADADVYLPRAHFGFGANSKDLGSVVSNVPNASASVATQYSYRTSPSASWSTFTSSFTVAPRQRVSFPAASAAVNLDQKITLQSSSTTVCPQVEGFGVASRLHTELRQVFQVRVLCEDGLTSRTGPLRIGQAQIRAYLQAAADPEASPGSVTIVLPDEQSRQFGVEWLGETEALDDRTGQIRAAIRLALVEIASNQVYGTYAKLEAAPTYGVLAAYTYGQLSRL